MEKMFKGSVFRIVIGMTLLIFLFNGISVSQEKKAETKKIFKEIAGKYEFSWEGESTIITFRIEEGKLIGAPEYEETVVLEPKEGEELKFQSTTPDGTIVEFEFIRDEKGKITKCLIIAMGMELEGKRIKDDKTLPA